MTIETEFQFEKMQEIGAIVANCLEMMKAKARPGMTTLELDELAQNFLANAGATSAPKSTYNFPGFTCISVEKICAHGIPSNQVLNAGDLINVDVSAHKDGFYADNGESFVIGRGSKTKRKLTQVVNQTLDAAISVARTGHLISSVGKACERVAHKNNLTIVRNLGGHGVGSSLHEEPKFIASYFDHKDRRIFSKNQVVAIEPFVSNGGREVDEADDGWSLYHCDYYVAQKEHTILVAEGRAHIFTQPTKHFE